MRPYGRGRHPAASVLAVGLPADNWSRRPGSVSESLRASQVFMQDQTTIEVNWREPSLYQRSYAPRTTFVLLALNALVFLLMTLADAYSHPHLLGLLLRTVTGMSVNEDLLLSFGASFGPYIRRGEYWRLVMPMFLHIGLIHLLINSYALFVLGVLLERVYGYGRFALLYVGAGVGSAFVSMTRSHSVSAGASGAIFGIAGAMLVTGYLHRDAVHRRWGRAFGAGILPLIVLNLVLGYALRSFVDNWGHLGGLASGILLALIIPPPRPDPHVNREPSQAVVVIPIAVVALAMTAAAQHYPTGRTVARIIEEGERHRAAHQIDRALDRFQEAARRAPVDERPHEELGSLYLEQKRVVEAIREYEEALRLNPDSPEARLGLAQAYEEKGDVARAQEYLKAVRKDYPRSAELQYVLASHYAQHNFYAEAAQHYQEALRLKPDMAVAHNDLAWLYATSEDPQFRDPRRALEHAQRAVALTNWKEPNFIDTLAEAQYANRSYDEAVKTQTKALKLSPDNRELQEHMARYRKAAGG